MEKKPQRLTPEQALPKARQYCAYQERSHKEVKDKLYGYGLGTKDVELLLSTLIEENYLNEERFAIQFAGGKFRMKQWGRVKIKYELKLRQVSEYCIKKALRSIDDEAYETTMNKVFETKLKSLKSEKNIFIKKRKLQDHMLQKGYESDLVKELIQAASIKQ